MQSKGKGMTTKQTHRDLAFYKQYDNGLLILIGEGVRKKENLRRRLGQIISEEEMEKLSDGITDLVFRRLQSLKHRRLIHYYRPVGWMLWYEWPESTPWGWVVKREPVPDGFKKAIAEVRREQVKETWADDEIPF